ncbi:amidohydrolase family protein [Gemmatimonadota bacterium]
MTRHQIRRRTFLSGLCHSAALLSLLFAIPAAAQNTQLPIHGEQYDRLLIRDVHLIDGNGTPMTGPSHVIVENDRITYVGRRVDGDFDAVIDGNGRFLLPGLINQHVHFRPHPHGGNYDGMQYQFNLMLGVGITTARVVGGENRSIPLREQSANGEIIAPRIFVYAGTGGETVEQAVESVQRAHELGADGIKFFGMDHEPMAAMLAEARRLGLRSAHHVGVEETDVWDDIAGHTTTIEHWYGIPDAAIPYGSQSFPPDYNYTNELDRFRWAGRLFKDADPEKLSVVLQTMVDSNVSWVPTLTIYEATRDITRAANQPWFEDFLHPTLENYYTPDLTSHGSFYLEWTTEDEIEWKNNYQLWFAALREFAERGGIIGAGDDAGFIYRMYGTGLIRELELQQEAGFHPLDVIKHATGNNALLLGAEDELGRIKAGYKADLILVNNNPLVNMKVLYPIPTTVPTAGGYEAGGMVAWTIKDGYVYDASRLREEVKEIVRTARLNIPRTLVP